MKASRHTLPILPPAMLGILGGGQLGMLFTLAAQSMGYQVTVVDPDPTSPAARFADVHLCEAFHDPQALITLVQTCAAVTTEFENVSAEAMRALAKHIPVHPAGDCIAIAQDRIAEKLFIQKIGLQTAPFLAILNTEAFQVDLTPYLPGILKMARFGYDGKGQMPVDTLEQALFGHTQWKHQPCVLEKRLFLQKEISVTAVRTSTGETATFPPAENQHAQGILDISIVPARISAEIKESAIQMATRLITALNYVGVLTVEFFIVDDDQLIINEIAPRPHNSAHYTLDATLSSQFDQQVRALCSLPPADTCLTHTACVMVNLLGELWQHGEPNWEKLLNASNVKLHLYGKRDARPGRKMGHYTVLASCVETALTQAKALKETL